MSDVECISRRFTDLIHSIEPGELSFTQWQVLCRSVTVDFTVRILREFKKIFIEPLTYQGPRPHEIPCGTLCGILEVKEE